MVGTWACIRNVIAQMVIAEAERANAVHVGVKLQLRVLFAAICASVLVASCTSGDVARPGGATVEDGTGPTSSVAVEAQVDTNHLVTAPLTRPAGIVSYACETRWVAHRSAHSLTFEGGDVTNTFGVEQHGVLTKAGSERLGGLLAAIDSTRIPDRFEGEALPLEERDVGTRCELHLDLVTTIRAYTWDRWDPPSDLADLHRFLDEAVVPLAACKTTYAIEVVEPCTYLGVG